MQEAAVVTVSGELTRARMRRTLLAFRHVTLRRVRLWLVMVSFVACLTMGLAAVQGLTPGPDLVVLLPVVAVVMAVPTIGSPWFATRSTARRAGVGLRVTTTFDASGVHTSSSRGDAFVPWSRVADLAVEDGLVVMFWQPPGCVAGAPADGVGVGDLAPVVPLWQAGRGQVPEPRATSAEDGGPWAEVVVRRPMTLPMMRRAQWFALRPTRVTWVGVLFTVLLLGPVLMGLPSGSLDLTPLVAVVACAAFLVALVERTARRSVSRLGGRDVEWRLGPSGFTTTTSLGSSRVAWTAVGRTLERDGLLLLRPAQGRGAYVIPVDGLPPSDLAQVRDWMACSTVVTG